MQNISLALSYHFFIQQAIRDFFKSKNFLDVLTPPMVSNPGMEPHIHPFQVKSIYKGTDLPMYLHTSPEFWMKSLLSKDFKNIFTMNYCFRDEPNSPIHRNQFIMLEWYRANCRYEKIMDDTIELFKFCHDYLKNKNAPMKKDFYKVSFEKITIQNLFLEYLNIDILMFLEKTELLKLLSSEFKDIPLPKNTDNLSWDDLYFLLFLNKIEPKLVDRDFLLLYEFPFHLSALSTIKKDDPRVCERFEVYVNGIELCNCFNELTDINVQKQRFESSSSEKYDLYQYRLPTPTILYEALEKGIPNSAGIALGVERLLLSLVDVKNPFFI